MSEAQNETKTAAPQGNAPKEQQNRGAGGPGGERRGPRPGGGGPGGDRGGPPHRGGGERGGGDRGGDRGDRGRPDMMFDIDLEKLLLAVTRRNDIKGFERFRDLFEAIIAYNE